MKLTYAGEEFEADPFDGTNLQSGMDWDEGGAFVITKKGKEYVNEGDFVIHLSGDSATVHGDLLHVSKDDVFFAKQDSLK